MADAGSLSTELTSTYHFILTSAAPCSAQSLANLRWPRRRRGKKSPPIAQVRFNPADDQRQEQLEEQLCADTATQIREWQRLEVFEDIGALAQKYGAGRGRHPSIIDCDRGQKCRHCRHCNIMPFQTLLDY